MLDLWTERRALWVDAVIAVAALVSLQIHAADPDTVGWPFAPWWARLLVMALPLLIVIRRFVPEVAFIGLLFAGYLAGFVGQPPWLLYGGAVLALWSLAGSCRVPTTIAVAAVPAGGLILLDRLRDDNLMTFMYSFPNSLRDRTELFNAHDGIAWDDWYTLERRQWPWWLAAATVALAVVFLVIRHRTQAVPVQQRRAELWAFLRSTDDQWVRMVPLAFATAGLILNEVGHDLLRGGWWSAPNWMPYGVVIAGLSLALRRWPAIPVGLLAVASLIANWQSFGPTFSLYGAFGLALYWLVVSPKRARSLRWTLPVAIGVLALFPLITRVMRVRYLQLLFPRIKSDGWHHSYNGVLHNETYDAIAEHDWPFTLSLVLLVPILAAIAVRQYRRNRVADQREAELEQVAEELEAEQVVLTERSIIARDLHDVVAHAVNLMVIQAETGPDLVRRGEVDVLAGFQRIGDAGRRALSELDRLLSTLRDEDGIADPQLAPQPGLADLSQLVADVSKDHLPIELDLQGDLETPPEGQQLTAYRLVQEALTNVIKHAKATGVRVAVRSEETGVRVEVTDDGVGFDVAAARRGNRHGLAGMRERVRIEGGSLDIRSTPGAGTTVEAWIPVGGRR
ncbi:sensor histidine kinase [Kribbella antibiotica]|uniref:sensor histidine kinase n=1 Tax=Kribbella antibiotica TaxID=190195 RepID=UPI001404F455|nr:sensor histidine kinase [Kribbella antibiotica]